MITRNNPIRNAIALVLAWWLYTWVQFAHSAERPYVWFPVAHSGGYEETQTIGPNLECLKHGWDSPQWLQRLDRLAKHVNAQGVWLHLPCGDGVDGLRPQFDQYRIAFGTPGLERIVDRTAYKRMIRLLAKRGLHTVSYWASPNNMIEAPSQLDDWMIEQVEWMRFGNARVCFDAPSSNKFGDPDITYNFLTAIDWADKGSPSIIEGVPRRAEARFNRWDQVTTSWVFDVRNVPETQSDFYGGPLITEADFPLEQTQYVLYGRLTKSSNPNKPEGRHTLQSISEHVAWLHSIQPKLKIVPVVHWLIINDDVKAGGDGKL